MRWFEFQTWPRSLAYGTACLIAAFEIVVLVLSLRPDTDPAYLAYFVARTTTCLDKKVPATYRVGDTVSFRPDGRQAAQQIRVCGWSNPDGRGTPSRGESSRLRVRLGVADRGLVLVLRLASTPPQTVVVWAGGKKLGQIDLPGANAEVEAAFALPQSIDTPGNLLDIELSYPYAILPNPRTSNVYKQAIRLVSFKIDIV